MIFHTTACAGEHARVCSIEVERLDDHYLRRPPTRGALEILQRKDFPQAR